MIISHKYKYLFIEIPVTGSYAVRNELCHYYDGSSILHKHASYPEFLRIASDEERGYFVFATVRNPLDSLVSSYFKLKTDHKGAFSNPESVKEMKTDYPDHQAYEFIQSTNATFESFFCDYCGDEPYSNMIEVSSKHLDFVIRYENLQEDFAEVLHRLGIEQVRPVPVLNKTQDRKDNWQSYYTPKAVERAKVVAGPFMKKWGYEFPSNWGDCRVPWTRQARFCLVNVRKSIYLNYIRYNDRVYAKFIKKLRARL